MGASTEAPCSLCTRCAQAQHSLPPRMANEKMGEQRRRQHGVGGQECERRREKVKSRARRLGMVVEEGGKGVMLVGVNLFSPDDDDIHS